MTVACPSDDDLLAYVGRTLEPSRRSMIETHLASCESCPAVAAAAARELHTSDAGDGIPTADEGGGGPVVILPAGAKLGRYVILDLLGRGSMGVVYGAYDPQLDRKVALKVVRPDRQHTALAERFVREGQTMARLSHPNVVAVHDVGVLDGGIFLAMEHVQGVTLRQWLAASPRTWRAILAAYLDAGRGLAAAHHAGVVHRDFKPENVLVGSDGRVRVTDFGLARFGDADDEPGTTRGDEPTPISMTQTGAVLGTPAFMAPEQLRGESVTAAADQFSFSSALYQALYAQQPFAGENFAALRVAVLAGELREPPRSSVPAHIRRALRRGLAHEAAQRFPSMTELLAAIEADPRRRMVRVATVALPLAIAGGVVAWQLARTEAAVVTPCQAGASRVAAVWNDGTRYATSSAFHATGLPFADRTAELVRGQLDRYGSAWGNAYLEACEATHVRGDQSSALLDRRMACLDERLRDLSAASRALVAADRKTVEKATNLTDALRPITACGQRDRLLASVAPPDDPMVKARVDSVRDQLAAVRVKLTAGTAGPETLTIAEGIAASAATAGYPPVIPEARQVLGTVQFGNGKFDQSQASHEAAFLGAERTGNDELAETALTALVDALTVAQKLDDALRWASIAEAKVERLGTPPLLRAELLRVKAVALETKFSAAEAVPIAEEALRIHERELGQNDVRTIEAALAVAQTLFRASRYAEALPFNRRAVADYEQVLGPDHPRVARALHELASTLKAVGKRREGLAVIQRALALNEQQLGKEHMWVGTNMFPLGQIQAELGDRAAAVATFRRSIAIIEHAGGAENAQLIPPLVMLCNTGVSLPAERATSLPACARARTLAVAAAGPESGLSAIIDYIDSTTFEYLDRVDEMCRRLAHPAAVMLKTMKDHSDRALTMLAESRCHRWNGEPARAVAISTEALALVEKAFGPTHADVASARVELGTALAAAGDASHAVEQLERAVTDLAPAELEEAVKQEATFRLGMVLRARGGDRARADRLVREGGRPLLDAPYATPVLRREIRAALAVE